MIIVRLMGGLGNQMFQYAAGRRLAHKSKTPLKLDLDRFNSSSNVDTPRKYELSVFNIEEDFASEDEVKKLKKAWNSKYRKFLTSLQITSPHKTYIREKHFHFDPEVLQLSDNVYLEGYWQSEKYFNGIDDIIREEFTFKDKQDAINRQLAEKIKNVDSVSIHIRRGDYVSCPATSQFHGVCPLNYYEKAVNSLASKVNEPHFFAFSDDPDWVRENMKFNYPLTVIDHNYGDKAYEDLRLMSLCRHHILANSSFSWWGAWLNENPDKIVIAPGHWFKDSSIDTNDLIPDDWMTI